MSPKNPYVEGLTPSTSECGCIWRWIIKVVIKLTWGCEGGAVIRYDRGPYKKRKLGNRYTEREDHVKTRGKRWSSKTQVERPQKTLTPLTL